jgi:hypothetical protein
MTGGFSPWSKFNAHSWSVLNAHRQAIDSRIVDLHPITREHYYHPDQEGSWSLKRVLPTIASDLGYETLDGVQDGGMAMSAWMEAVFPGELPSRDKAEIDRQLREYCKLDTLAMVRLWQMLSGKSRP